MCLSVCVCVSFALHNFLVSSCVVSVLSQSGLRTLIVGELQSCATFLTPAVVRLSFYFPVMNFTGWGTLHWRCTFSLLSSTPILTNIRSCQFSNMNVNLHQISLKAVYWNARPCGGAPAGNLSLWCQNVKGITGGNYKSRHVSCLCFVIFRLLIINPSGDIILPLFADCVVLPFSKGGTNTVLQHLLVLI